MAQNNINTMSIDDLIDYAKTTRKELNETIDNLIANKREKGKGLNLEQSKHGDVK